MKRIVTMMLCLIGMAVSMQAQTLSGKLVDEKNEPLAYANVVLLQADSLRYVWFPDILWLDSPVLR